MKNYLFLAVVVALASCQTTTDTNDQLDGFKTNQASADAAFNLFENGSLDEMSEMYADEMFWSPPNTTDSLSKADWHSSMKEWHINFENFSFDERLYYPSVDESFVPNGGVRVYGTWSSTHKATGAATKTKYYAVMEYNDEGKVSGTMEWCDLGGVFDQIETQTVVPEDELVDE